MTSLIASVFILVSSLFSSVPALADTPLVTAEVLDSDGQVTPTQWRTTSTFIWSQTHLLLQAAIEIPSHLASQLPDSLQSSLRGPLFHGPFHLADDHVFLILEMHAPTEMFKLGDAQSLRIRADFTDTTWMRNSTCRDVNAYLNPTQGNTTGARNALMLSLFCKSVKGGTWIEVASSDEVTLDFDPHDQTRFRSLGSGAEFWLPEGASRRTLADVTVTGANGEETSSYALEVQASSATYSAAHPAVQSTLPADALPILVADPTGSISERGSGVVITRNSPVRRPLLGVEAQILEAHGAIDHGRTGKTQTEIALTGRYTKAVSSFGIKDENFIGNLEADLNLPIRRLGAGLDSKGAGSHIGWLNVGYEWPLSSNRQAGGLTSLTFGAQSSLLDVYAPDRQSTFALSPSVQARFGELYSVVIAPFDVLGNLALARARADFPVTSDRKNRLTLEAFLGRTWIQPQDKSWNVNGVTLGFNGEF